MAKRDPFPLDRLPDPDDFYRDLFFVTVSGIALGVLFITCFCATL